MECFPTHTVGVWFIGTQCSQFHVGSAQVSHLLRPDSVSAQGVAHDLRTDLISQAGSAHAYCLPEQVIRSWIGWLLD